MRIGIITLYYNNKNVGGLLQSYAMVDVLVRLGYDAEQISYDVLKSNDKINEYLMKRRKILIKQSSVKELIKKFTFYFNRRINCISKDIQEVQDGVFMNFIDYIPHSKKIYDESNISEAEQEYDAFLVGSDQVWNPSMLVRDAYYLSFTKKKKIAYAVSMGKTDLIEIEKDLFRNRLKFFSEVGVREKKMIDVIESLSDVNCECVLDPTLLLKCEDWQKIENGCIIPDKQYIFCYFLGDCVWQRKIVQRYAYEKGYLIVDLPYIMNIKRKSDKVLKGEHLYDVGPREFISLIKNAECVFTDSFHAVAFSVNFKTDFYTFDRDGISGKSSINSRIIDFLELLSLKNRRIEKNIEHFNEDEIDWLKITSILDIHRKKSMEWLKSQLEK